MFFFLQIVAPNSNSPDVDLIGPLDRGVLLDILFISIVNWYLRVDMGVNGSPNDSI